MSADAPVFGLPDIVGLVWMQCVSAVAVRQARVLGLGPVIRWIHTVKDAGKDPPVLRSSRILDRITVSVAFVRASQGTGFVRVFYKFPDAWVQWY